MGLLNREATLDISPNSGTFTAECNLFGVFGVILISNPESHCMQRFKIFILILGLLPLSNCVFASQDGDGTKESMISGSVSDASSKKPVKGVTISITTAKDKVEKLVTTDASGQFIIPKLPAGEVTIILEKKGYKTYRKEKFVIREGMQVKLKVDMSNEREHEDSNLFHPLLRMMES